MSQTPQHTTKQTADDSLAVERAIDLKTANWGPNECIIRQVEPHGEAPVVDAEDGAATTPTSEPTSEASCPQGNPVVLDPQNGSAPLQFLYDRDSFPPHIDTVYAHLLVGKQNVGKTTMFNNTLSPVNAVFKGSQARTQ